jgi:hypothetical protein
MREMPFDGMEKWNSHEHVANRAAERNNEDTMNFGWIEPLRKFVILEEVAKDAVNSPSIDSFDPFEDAMPKGFANPLAGSANLSHLFRISLNILQLSGRELFRRIHG